ncbi:MAG: biotin/lipoyl-binding protein [Clostridia bacterium]|nr:biotin/lipoyl-binding protein [Clostridia bacterium]
MRYPQRIATGPRQKSRRISYAFLLYTVILTVLPGCRLLPADEEALAPPVKKPPAIQYKTREIKKGTLVKTIECSGQFTAAKQYNLCFRDQGGRLKSIHVKLGDQVKKGDILAELYSEDVKRQLDEQEATIAKAAYESSCKESAAKRSAAQAKSSFITAQNKYNSMLAIKDAFSLVDLDNAKNDLEAASNDYQNLSDQYGNLIKQNELDMKILKMKRDKLAEELSRIRIVAEASGSIVFLDDVKLGDEVTANKTFVSIASDENLLVQYTGNKLSEFKIGMPLEVVIHGEKHPGQVVMTRENAPKDANEETKNSVFIRVDSIPQGTLIGDSVDIKLTLEKKEDVISIPKHLLQKYKNTFFVYVLDQGIRREKPVAAGMETDLDVEIVKGLEVGDQLIE